jgi:ABC-type transport system substrate-binding protein
MPESRRVGLHADVDALEIDAGDRDSNFLLDLATSASWVIRHPGAEPPGAPNGGVGTGPFRIAAWQPGRRLVLQANDDYWGGRPYLDAIEFEMGRPSREQLIDLELDRADLVQLDPAEARRAQQEGRKVWTSVPVELVCLRFNPGSPAAHDQRWREAITSSIDRGAIQKVLVQNYGEVTGAILPQWLSGYAFLFPSAADLERARKLKAEIGSLPALKVGYDRSDTLARQVAERLVVNARDAGITLEAAPLAPGLPRQAGAGSGVDAQVERARVDGPTLDEALSQALQALSFSTDGKDDPEKVYAAERDFLSTFLTVPLVYVPDLVGLGPRVRNWSRPAEREWGDWHLDEVWLEGRP